MLYAKVTEFISINPTSIIATLLNLLVLFLILKFILFKRVNSVIENRQKEIADSFEEADETKLHAKELEEEYAAKLDKAHEESEAIMRDTTKKAQERGDKIIDDANREAREIIDKAHTEVEREKRRAVNSVKNDITDIAFDVAQTLVGKEISRQDNERLIDEFIDNIGESDD